jgi:hypothetical protein
VISPGELIEEIKPWEPDSWRKFINEHVVPLKALGENVSKQFAGDPSERAAKAVSEAASSVIEAAKRSVGDVKEEFEVPSDPIESIRLLVEKAANTFLGVDEGGKYTLFAWTLRKITREYIEVLYPALKDEEKRKATFSILGVRELYRPPVRSPLADRLAILGYPDYASLAKVEEWGGHVTLRILPAREKTLGGALCRLVDGIVEGLARPGILSSVELSVDVVGTYIKACPQIPLQIFPQAYGNIRCWAQIGWKDCYELLSEDRAWRYDHAWAVKGFSLKCVDDIYPDREEGSAYAATNFLSFLRLVMPALVTGRAELLISAEGRVLATLMRVW